MAVYDREPAGKPVQLCLKKSVRLTLHNPDEAVYKEQGLADLRQHRLIRITKEAIEQGALLSYEDIAFLLTTSVVTIKRDIVYLRRAGIIIPSRGWRHDMGRGTTHKTQILELYLSGYQFSEIEKRTHHSETAVKRYIQDFCRIILLHMKNLFGDQIHLQRISIIALWVNTSVFIKNVLSKITTALRICSISPAYRNRQVVKNLKLRE